MKVKTKNVVVELSMGWREWRPYQCMVDDGEIMEEHFVAASKHIVDTIVKEAASGRPFKASWNTITGTMWKYRDLGFADSEPHAIAEDICCKIWRDAAENYLRSY